MSAALDPHRATTLVPGWEHGCTAIERIAGGLTNRSYKVTRPDGIYVLRLDAPHTRSFGLDRERERRVLGHAAGAGLAPEVVFTDTAAGILVSRFVAGEPWKSDDFDDKANVERVAGVLRRVHALPVTGTPFVALDVANRYLTRLGAAGLPGAVERRIFNLLDRPSAPGERRCCHNDVVAENLLGRDPPYLIDWEYACDNDPLFDLASLVAYHDLREPTQAALLGAYAGAVTPELRERLAAQIRIYDALCYLWFAVRQSVSPNAAQLRRLEELDARLS